MNPNFLKATDPAYTQEQVCAVIPHRPPFLFIDSVLSLNENAIRTSYTVQPKDVAGHYPGNPLMPGVLLCELVFQAAAFFLGKQQQNGPLDARTPVLSKILEARFRQKALPGDRLEAEATFEEAAAGFYFFKGRVSKDSKTVLTLRCVLALVGGDSGEL